MYVLPAKTSEQARPAQGQPPTCQAVPDGQTSQFQDRREDAAAEQAWANACCLAGLLAKVLVERAPVSPGDVLRGSFATCHVKSLWRAPRILNPRQLRIEIPESGLGFFPEKKMSRILLRFLSGDVVPWDSGRPGTNWIRRAGK